MYTCENPLIFGEFSVEDRIQIDTKREIRGGSGSKTIECYTVEGSYIGNVKDRDQCAGCQKIFLLSHQVSLVLARYLNANSNVHWS